MHVCATDTVFLFVIIVNVFIISGVVIFVLVGGSVSLFSLLCNESGCSDVNSQ